MARPASAAGRSAWLKDANSFLFSAACHLVMLILLGVCTVAAGRGWRGIELLAHVSDGRDVPGDDALLATVQLEAAPPESGGIVILTGRRGAVGGDGQDPGVLGA